MIGTKAIQLHIHKELDLKCALSYQLNLFIHFGRFMEILFTIIQVMIRKSENVKIKKIRVFNSQCI